MFTIFSPVYGKHLLERFQLIANTITNEYIEDFYQHLLVHDTVPTFEDLMQKTKMLQDDLTYRLTWVREDYKEERGRHSPRLTKGCKRIISTSVQHYISVVKNILACRPQSGQISPTEFRKFLIA